MAQVKMANMVLEDLTWHVKVRVPAALKTVLGRSILSRSTGQHDPHKAALVAAPIRAEFKEIIAQAKRGNLPDPVQAQVRAMAKAWKDANGDHPNLDAEDVVAFVLANIAKVPWQAPQAGEGPYHDVHRETLVGLKGRAGEAALAAFDAARQSV